MSNNTGPNILLIQADQMAASALSAYGNSFTTVSYTHLTLPTMMSV